jgi:hypothetical protein
MSRKARHVGGVQGLKGLSVDAHPRDSAKLDTLHDPTYPARMARSDRAELADGLVALAAIVASRDARDARAILLCTAVVLRDARTITNARNRIIAWDGPARVQAGVLRLLDIIDGCETQQRKGSRMTGDLVPRIDTRPLGVGARDSDGEHVCPACRKRIEAGQRMASRGGQWWQVYPCVVNAE